MSPIASRSCTSAKLSSWRRRNRFTQNRSCLTQRRSSPPCRFPIPQSKRRAGALCLKATCLRQLIPPAAVASTRAAPMRLTNAERSSRNSSKSSRITWPRAFVSAQSSRISSTLRRGVLPDCKHSDGGESRENLGLLDIYRQCELNLSGWLHGLQSQCARTLAQLGNDIDAPILGLPV